MKKIMLPILMVFILGLVGIANAAFTCTVVAPATSGTMQASSLFNITYIGTHNYTVINCSITASSSIGGSWTVGTAYNYTDSGIPDSPYANATISTTSQIDATDWAVSATCTNGTATATCTGTTSVTIDNTVPVCSQSILASNTQYDLKDTTTLTVTCTNATSSYAYFGGNYYDLTESSDSCTLDMSSIPPTTYDVTITTSDGTNTTSCTALTSVTLVKSSASAGAGALVIKSILENPDSNTLSVAGDATTKASNFFSKELQAKELMKTGIGALVGAVVGTMIIPFLGTGLGAAVGAIVGVIF